MHVCSGHLKINFIPGLVGPFLEMTLIPATGQFLNESYEMFLTKRLIDCCGSFTAVAVVQQSAMSPHKKL